MKKIIFFTLLIVFSLAAKPQENKVVLNNNTENITSIVIKDSVKNEIIEVAKKMAKDNEYISHKVKENRDKLEEMKKIEAQEDYIFYKILKYLKKNKNPPTSTSTSTSTIVYGEDIISYIPSNDVAIKVVTKEKFYAKDSICTSYDRNFFGIKKCEEWDFKYTEIK